MSTAPKPFAFVLMPFSPAFDDAYKLAIKPACDVAGAYAERVDEQIFSGSILERIYNQISKADLVIADMSERNPNVFYEVGYAHAIGKTTVLITRSAEDIPFDLKHFPHIVYEGSLVTLRESLEGTVRWHLKNVSAVEEVNVDVQVRVNGIPLSNATVVEVKVNKGAFGTPLTIEVENHFGRTIGPVEGRLGILYPSEFASIEQVENYGTTEVLLDRVTRLCLIGQRLALLPGEWWSHTIPITRSNRSFEANEKIALSIRLLRASGVRDFPFTLRFQHK
jgi:nucleoside 2-deoxyribosyltransferase